MIRKVLYLMLLLGVAAVSHSTRRRRMGMKQHNQRNRVQPQQEATFFVQGDLGVVKPTNKKPFLEAATEAMMEFLTEYANAAGTETLIPGDVITTDGQKHVRFQEEIESVPVEGASMMMHVDEDGRVFAANGEFVSAKELRGYNVTMDCETASEIALEDSDIAGGEWVSNCTDQAIVRDDQGQAHLTWKRDIAYVYQRDTLYASTMTGDLIARLPQVMTESGGFAGEGKH